MNRYEALMQRIADGECILIDGATGTEIEVRGVPQVDDAWNSSGALTHPDIVRQVHEDYIRHGAEIVISNTFATGRNVTRDAGMEDQFEFLNRHGVETGNRSTREQPNTQRAGRRRHFTLVVHQQPSFIRGIAPQHRGASQHYGRCRS